MGQIKTSASAALAALGGQLVIFGLGGAALYWYIQEMIRLWSENFLWFSFGALIGVGAVLITAASIMIYRKRKKEASSNLE